MLVTITLFTVLLGLLCRLQYIGSFLKLDIDYWFIQYVKAIVVCINTISVEKSLSYWNKL
jgi:hypothetical protein